MEEKLDTAGGYQAYLTWEDTLRVFLSHIDRLPEHLSARSLQTVLAFSVTPALRNLVRQRAGDYWDSPAFDWAFARGHLAELCKADELSLRDAIS